MVELAHHLTEPASLHVHRALDPQGSWESLPHVPEKRDLRHQLNTEQEGLCIYCEDQLSPDTGHIDHIVPRSHNRALTFVYSNLAHSCGNRGRCGDAKDNKLLPIEPRPGCSAYFEVSVTTGRLAPNRRETKADQDRAKTTLELLGLNRDPGLARQRQQHALTVVKLAQQAPADAQAYIANVPFRWSLRSVVA